MFSFTLQTGIVIDASPVRVWSLLEDVASYPQWNPFVTGIAGPLVAGREIKVTVAPPGERAMTFRAVVLAADPVRGSCWRGRLPVPGLFAGEHSFRIVPDGPAA